MVNTEPEYGLRAKIVASETNLAVLKGTFLSIVFFDTRFFAVCQ
jgi:hypothetical protein